MGPNGGDKRDRTVDPLLAKQVLYQLSYTPKKVFISFEDQRPSKLNNAKTSKLTKIISQTKA